MAMVVVLMSRLLRGRVGGHAVLGSEREARRWGVGARRVGVGILVGALPPLAEGFLRGDRQVACAGPQRGREGQCADGVGWSKGQYIFK